MLILDSEYCFSLLCLAELHTTVFSALCACYSMDTGLIVHKLGLSIIMNNFLLSPCT